MTLPFALIQALQAMSKSFVWSLPLGIGREAKILARILYKFSVTTKKRKEIGMILTFGRKRQS
jgi:hypothetical protein